MQSHSEKSAMSCPHCAVPLVMTDRQGVEIDYCPTCRGVWLDRGELDKIIERASRDMASLAGSAPSAPAAYGHAPAHKPYKRRKSFLEELFD